MTIAEIDLHVHSRYSHDSLSKLGKIVKIAKRKGLNGIAITDHGTIHGGLSAKKCDANDFIIIIGTEIKTEIGDIIGLFLNEEIRSRGIWCVIDEIRDQNGLVVLPHPFRGHDTNKFDKELLNKIDAIEGYNARSDVNENILAQEFAKVHKLPIIAGSDAHFYGEIGLAKTIMGNISSEEDIRKSILSYGTRIVGTQTPLYFRGASRILTDAKTGNYYKLPYTLVKILIKGVKTYVNKIENVNNNEKSKKCKGKK